MKEERRFFDPAFWEVTYFDQRGCGVERRGAARAPGAVSRSVAARALAGQSTPFACLEENTTVRGHALARVLEAALTCVRAHVRACVRAVGPGGGR